MDEAGGCFFCVRIIFGMPATTAPSSRAEPAWAPRSEDGAVRPANAALPPPPPGCRYVPVKWVGVVIADDSLRRRIERYFHVPMIVLALLVLPLLVLDYAYIREANGGAATRGWLWWLVIGGLTLIWIAFTVEFIVKIAIAEHRWEYLRRNWLDLIIIVIPLLRPLRVAALARTSQAFRLRGVGFKLARYVFTLLIGMEATNRLMLRMGVKRRTSRADPHDMTRHELTCEVVRLRNLADAWAAWYDDQQAYLHRTGQPGLPSDRPLEGLPRNGVAAQPLSDPCDAADATPHER